MSDNAKGQSPAAMPWFDDDGVFLGPVEAATHAVVAQGGFSDPAIEAERMLKDGGLLAARAQAWLDATPADERSWKLEALVVRMIGQPDPLARSIEEEVAPAGAEEHDPDVSAPAADPLEVWLNFYSQDDVDVVDAAGGQVAHAAMLTPPDDQHAFWKLGPFLVAPATIVGAEEPSDDPTVDAAVRVAALDEEIQSLEAILRDRKKRREKAEEVMLARFEDSALDRIRVAGRTVYLQGRVFARANPETGGTEALAAAFRADPATADLVKDSVNANTLSSWVRDFEREIGDGRPRSVDELHELIPEHLRPLIVVQKVWRVGTRAAG